jgi:hypothetical protein
MDEPATRVYAIRAGLTKFVKIGESSNPRSRRDQLQTAHYEELNLLGLFPERFGNEAELHDRLAAHRVRGEWFRMEGLVVDLLAQLEPLPDSDSTDVLYLRVPLDLAERLDREVERERVRHPGRSLTRLDLAREILLEGVGAREARS